MNTVITFRPVGCSRAHGTSVTCGPTCGTETDWRTASQPKKRRRVKRTEPPTQREYELALAGIQLSALGQQGMAMNKKIDAMKERHKGELAALYAKRANIRARMAEVAYAAGIDHAEDTNGWSIVTPIKRDRFSPSERRAFRRNCFGGGGDAA